MKKELTEIHGILSMIEVKGMDVERMYIVLSRLASLINSMPEETEVVNEIPDTE